MADLASQEAESAQEFTRPSGIRGQPDAKLCLRTPGPASAEGQVLPEVRSTSTQEMRFCARARGSRLRRDTVTLSLVHSLGSPDRSTSLSPWEVLNESYYDHGSALPRPSIPSLMQQPWRHKTTDSQCFFKIGNFQINSSMIDDVTSATPEPRRRVAVASPPRFLECGWEPASQRLGPFTSGTLCVAASQTWLTKGANPEGPLQSSELRQPLLSSHIAS